MSEINLKSSALQDRETFTHRFTALMTVGDGGSVTESIDVIGLTVANTAATTFTLAGFEAASGMSLDPAGHPTCKLVDKGTLTGITAAEAEANYAVAISGTAGSRIATVTVTAAVFTSTDSIAAGKFEWSLPLKQKDY